MTLLLCPHDRDERLWCNHRDALVVLQRQEIFIAGHDGGGLSTLSRSNHQVIVRIADHDGYLRQIGYEVRKVTESLNKMTLLLDSGVLYLL